MALKLILALATATAARDDSESKLLAAKGLVDGGRRLTTIQNDPTVSWDCTHGGVWSGVYLYFPAQGDDCPTDMVPADAAACNLLDDEWGGIAPGAADSCGGRPSSVSQGNGGTAIYDSSVNCVYSPSGNHMPCWRTASNGNVYYTNNDNGNQCTKDMCDNLMEGGLAASPACQGDSAQGVCMLAPPPDPTAKPTADPTASPTFSPTLSPTFNPTPDPTASPTFSPTLSPTFNPTPDQYEPLRVATADLSTKINSASNYEEAKVQVKVVKKLTKALPACAAPYKEMLRKNTNQLLRRIRKKKAWSDLAGRLTTIMNLQDNLQACA